MIDIKRPWWTEEASSVLSAYKVDLDQGLSTAEVQQRQKYYGKNEIPPPPSTSIFKLILDQFSDLLVLILLGAAVISFVLALFEEGDDKLTAFVEPAVILTILILNAVVGVLQETKAEKAIEALKESEARDAIVIRDSHQQTVHSSELVPGDVIVVAVGDKVPADGRLVHFYSPTLLVDEATLTGESEATQKRQEVVNIKNAVNQDKRNMVFSGTLVVRGKAKAVVTTTGSTTEMGAIAHDLSSDDDEKTPLQEKLDEFGEQLSKIIAAICVTVWLMNIGHFTDPDHGSIFKGAIYYFKIAVALAVAAIPEGLPAVVTTCLALGTMKMAKKNAIVRSLPSVETLGCTTVICSDKTGTLTTNQMSVQKILAVDSAATVGKVTFKEYEVEGDSFAPIGRIVALQPNGHTHIAEKAVSASTDPSLVVLGKISALCNEATLGWKPVQHEPSFKPATYTKTGAATEAALLVLAEKIGLPSGEATERLDEHQRATYARSHWDKTNERVAVLEFDRDRKSMSVLVKSNEGGRQQHWLYCKGAPEGVLDRCTHVRDASNKSTPLTQTIRNTIQQHMDHYASEGLRCLALAELANPNPSADYTDMSQYAQYESRMTFVGLVAMLDPPRSQVPDAIARCRTAGIRVIVITGDNPTTAESICHRIGVFSGSGQDVSAAVDQNGHQLSPITGSKTPSLKGLSYTGAQLEAMSDAEKRQAIKTALLFSRVEPKHKLEIVTLLKEAGEVVAMTGDGVNDATALRRSDIGIAMGSGTDVAREASNMVLQDDNFATIVMAVEEGRSIYANTKQFIRYLISSNIGEVACIFLVAMLGTPEALIPVQLLWVNLVTDGLPATALGFNPPDPDIMTLPPRGRTERIINRWTFIRYMVIGIYVGLGTVGGFIWWYLYAQSGPHLTWQQLTNFHGCASDALGIYKGINCDIFHDPRPSTVSLSILVTIEMFNALNALSENQSLSVVTPLSNYYVIAACTLSFALHFFIIYTPFFAGIFHVTPLNTEEWLYVVYFSLPIFLIDEILKYISRQQNGTYQRAVERKSD